MHRVARRADHERADAAAREPRELGVVGERAVARDLDEPDRPAAASGAVNWASRPCPPAGDSCATRRYAPVRGTARAPSGPSVGEQLPITGNGRRLAGSDRSSNAGRTNTARSTGSSPSRADPQRERRAHRDADDRERAADAAASPPDGERVARPAATSSREPVEREVRRLADDRGRAVRPHVGRVTDRAPSPRPELLEHRPEQLERLAPVGAEPVQEHEAHASGPGR